MGSEQTTLSDLRVGDLIGFNAPDGEVFVAVYLGPRLSVTAPPDTFHSVYVISDKSLNHGWLQSGYDFHVGACFNNIRVLAPLTPIP